MTILCYKEYIASLMSSLKWRHFGVGALQAYLYEGPTFEQRIHIWHPDLVKPGIQGFGDLHNHRFSFLSHVIYGSLENHVYVTEECSESEASHNIYEVENARAARDRLSGIHQKILYHGEYSKVGHCLAKLAVIRQVNDWQTYEFLRGEYHRTVVPFGMAISIVTKFDQQRIRARILCPRNEQLVHAFDTPASDSKIQEIVKEARQRLHD